MCRERDKFNRRFIIMNRKIDVIICSNKNLIVLKRLVDQIYNQKGSFNFNIFIIHQYKKNFIMPNFLKKKNIFYKNLKKNSLSFAKNEGIKLSISNVVCFLDDDVSISKNYFLLNWNFLQKKKCDLAFSKINIINSNKPFSQNMKNFDQQINFFNTSSCLASSMWINFKNGKKSYFDTNFGLGSLYGSGEETDFIFSALEKKKNIQYSSTTTIYHPNSLSIEKNNLKISSKFILYGKGQGAIFKKRILQKKNYFYLLYLNSIVKSLLAILFFTLTFRKGDIIKHSSLLLGKISGFLKYQIN